MGRRARRRSMQRDPFLATYRDPAFLAALAGDDGPTPPRRRLRARRRDVPPLRRRARSSPSPSTCTAPTPTCPRTSSPGSPRWACFGLSVPEEYGGFADGRRERLPGRWSSPPRSCRRGSLGIGGSLITRPEILTRALVKGGTEEQKQRLAAEASRSGRDDGRRRRDRARLRLRRRRHQGHRDAGRRLRRRAGWTINGVKTWCTFGARADVLMLLARTDPDRTKTHRGLSLFVVPKPRGEGHGFEFAQDGDAAGKIEGRAIDTIGYRGMHSYEVAFDGLVGARRLPDRWRRRPRPGLLPADGGLRERPPADGGARAVGVMQAAYEAAARVRAATASCSAARSATTSSPR